MATVSTYTGGALDGKDFMLITVTEEGGRYDYTYSRKGYETFEEAQAACHVLIQAGKVQGAIIYQEMARVYPLPEKFTIQ